MYNICPIFIIIYQVPNKSIIHDRYLTTQYVCDMCMICIVYVPVFLHSYYTYQIPDTCAVVKYHTHIMYMSHTYRVPDMYPIASISTSGDSKIISGLVISLPFSNPLSPPITSFCLDSLNIFKICSNK